MICEACQERRHGECRGGTWCDCQHQPPAGRPHADKPHDDQTADAEPLEEDGAEPRINWLRQG